MASIKPNGSISVDKDEGEPYPEMMAAAEDLIRAVHMKDAKAVAEALAAAVDIGSNASFEGEE